VEPSPKVFESLQKNRLSSLKINAAIYDQSGDQLFVEAERFSSILAAADTENLRRHFGNNLARVEASVTLVPTMSLLQLVRHYKILEVDIIFIDVEGAELEVVSSMDWIKIAVKVVVIDSQKESIHKNQQVIDVMLGGNFILASKKEQNLVFLNKQFFENSVKDDKN